MKHAFLRRPLGEIVSAVVPKSKLVNAFYAGETLTLLEDIDLHPYARIPRGTTLTVLDYDDSTGITDLRFDKPVDGLHTWGQVLTLVPFDTDDVVCALNAAIAHSPGCAVEVVSDEDEPRRNYDFETRYAAMFDQLRAEEAGNS